MKDTVGMPPLSLTRWNSMSMKFVKAQYRRHIPKTQVPGLSLLLKASYLVGLTFVIQLLVILLEKDSDSTSY